MSNTVLAQVTGSLRSLKISYANAVVELQHRAEQRRQAGDQPGSIALLERSNALSEAALGIRRAEITASLAQSLTPALTQLAAVVGDAREATVKLKKAADTLAEAARVINIFSRLLQLFS